MNKKETEQETFTMKKCREAASRHVIIDQQFLIFGEVISPQWQHILVLDVTQDLHLLLELLLRGGDVLQPLHHHRRTFL